ncbi:zinc ABC transporter substrate-binding protein [Rhodobacterales bacterium]|nr:zinc ABC transporter substrate-binding protein [Rhodobacterales bacterium]
MLLCYIDQKVSRMNRQNDARGYRKFAGRCLGRTALAGALGLFAGLAGAHAEAPLVVTTIKPLHSIAAAVMDGVGSPEVLIDGASSPHGFALKPSQAGLLQKADAVFWIGAELAPSLEKPIDTMASNATVVELMDADGILQLDLREGANFDAHDHGHGHGHGHGHEGHEHEHESADAADADDHDHDHEDHDDHDGHDEHAEHAEHAEHGGEHEHHHHGDEKDAHIWLNPDNGVAIANVMAETLSELDPDHSAQYRENADAFAQKIKKLDSSIAEELSPLADKGFIVFHDAYHHFEHHYGIEASGAITLSPELLASADRVSEVQSRVQNSGITCVFQEPQFDSKLVAVVLEGSSARKGTLDPLGTELENGPDLYPALLQNLADNMSDCLKD